jgi:hypothetical protein
MGAVCLLEQNDSMKARKATNSRTSRPAYRWPWVVLVAVALAVALAVLWIRPEIARMRQMKDTSAPGTSRP